MSRPDPLASLDGLPAAPRRSRPPGLLLAVALLETLTLAVLVVNLAVNGHDAALARVIGPVHGCLYVAGIVLTWSGAFPRLVKALAIVPVLGAWVAAVVALRRRRARS